MMDDTNPYLPYTAKILEAWFETPGDRCIKTFKVSFEDEKVRDTWSHRPGQCAMVGRLGTGESMFCISSSPTEEGYLRFSIMRAGKNTAALHELEAGDTMTVRGPLGNSFPVEEWEGKNIITIGGGIGQAPLRPVINYIRANKDSYGDLTVLYGARTSEDHCFKGEFEEFFSEGTTCHLSVDVEEEKWPHFVGFVPTLLMEVSPSPDNAIAVTCGPPVMINFVVQNLEKLGFAPEQIYTTLEERMKCGIGKCGRCNIGNLYVCKDGPVFSYATLKKIPEAFA
ncbi:MAG: FAD/NAD(P)-binding protein [Actinobacteria bacterium]|nr:FAD/NAD(P)-binding protein [Actinomycetota bacterium]MBU1944136.1 FAD/NAD(P)-binding protein [Actinomycetota bacterium]MBU2687455.1 FAD/NAD(P)-binding protein [Actinomycetota bacterium]